jgi:hypothetical protein
VCPLSLLLVLAVGAPADDRPVIDDKLKLFSARAVGNATKAIRELKEKFHVDLFIETTAEGPALTDKEKREWFGWRKRTFRHQTLDAFATNHGEALREKRQEEGGNFSGIYVVIIEEEGNREVGIGGWPTEHLADSKVSWVKRDALRKALEGKSDKDSADACLRDFLTLFEAQQREIVEPPQSPLGTRQALLVAGALAGAWLLLLFLRWRANQRVGPGEPEPVAIYQPAMMGTLFGVPAAFWVNDELFRALPPEVPPGPPPSASFTLPTMPAFPPDSPTQASGPAEPFSMPPDPSDPPPSA